MISLKLAHYINLLPGGLSVLELGDQNIEGINGIVGPRLSSCGTLSFRHTWTTYDIGSWNDGVIRQDISDIYPANNASFDLIIDGGTMEHVGKTDANHYQAWKNLHEWLKVGGMIISITQLPGSLPGHCKYRYDEQYFETWSQIGYSVSHSVFRWANSGHPLIMGTMQKMNNCNFLSHVDLFNAINIDLSPIEPFQNYPNHDPNS
jgi:hypothetical protein